jgi:hypothetical protein
MTPYPVIGSYLRTMETLNIIPFGGGTKEHQGERKEGYVLSGYRFHVLNGNKESPHRYAMALDIEAYRERQVVIGRTALESGFTRVGLYPQQGFAHVDVAPPNWMVRFHKARFWVKANGVYRYFDRWDEAEAFATTFY